MYKSSYAFLILMFSFTSNAALISPGGSISVPATDIATTPELAGAVINDNNININLFDDLPLFTSNYTYSNRVIRSDTNAATIIAPQLTWLNNITPFDFFIDQILLDGYFGVQTDIFYRTDAVGDRGPTNVERSLNGDQLLFTFGFPLFNGNLNQEAHQDSLPINILTDANAFELTGTATIFARSTEDITNTFTVTIFDLAVPTFVDEPPVTVSEPSSLTFSFLAFIGALTCAYRRKT